MKTGRADKAPQEAGSDLLVLGRALGKGGVRCYGFTAPQTALRAVVA